MANTPKIGSNNGGGGGGSSSLVVREIDGTPTGTGITEIVFNGRTGVGGEVVTIIGTSAYINGTPPPPVLQGNLSCSSTRYSARESNDTTPANTFHAGSAGDSNNYTINDSSFNSAPADFGNGSISDLTLELNGVVICTVELGTLFNEANRNTGQNMADYDGTAGDGTVILNGTAQFLAPYNGMGTLVINSVQSNTAGIFSDAYQEADVRVYLTTTGANSISEILRSGYNTLQLLHNGAQTNLLRLYYDYDTEITPNQPEPTVDGVSLTENTPVIKYLSGVRYYDGGSTFDADAVGHDCFDNVYHVSGRPLTYDDNSGGTDWGINETSSTEGILHTDASVSGLTNPPVFSETMTVDDFEITVPINQYTLDARIRFFARDPYADPHDNAVSATGNFAIESHNAVSTRLIERFYEEQWRCPLGADFDAVNAKSWSSPTHVTADDAVFTNGGCERNVRDWTIYDPDMVGQPDYSGVFMNDPVTLIREFNHVDGVGSSGFTLDISGTFSSLEMKMGSAWDGTASGGTVWVDMEQAYSFSDWNNGDPVGGTGCWTGGNHYTIGSNNFSNVTDGTLYIRVTFAAGERIDQMEVTFD